MKVVLKFEQGPLRDYNVIEGAARDVLCQGTQLRIWLQRVWVVHVSQQSSKQEPVVIISHSPAVVQLSSRVSQRSKRYTRISRAFWPREKSKLRHAYGQVAFVELVGDVPALWPETPSLLKEKGFNRIKPWRCSNVQKM